MKVYANSRKIEEITTKYLSTNGNLEKEHYLLEFDVKNSEVVDFTSRSRLMTLASQAEIQNSAELIENVLKGNDTAIMTFVALLLPLLRSNQVLANKVVAKLSNRYLILNKDKLKLVSVVY